MRRAYALAVLFLILAGSLSAATFEPITDAALTRRSDVVVVAHVLDSSSRVTPDGVIVTDYRLAVEDVLKGSAGATLVVTEAGGTANGLIMAIPGSAEYERGSRVVSFLRHRPDGTLFTTSMTLGAFVIERRPDGVEIATRREEGAAVDDAIAFAPRRADSFIRFVRDVARGFETEPVATIAAPPMVASNVFLNISADNFALFVGSPSLPVRWEQCGPNPDGCFLPYFWNGDQGTGFNESNAVSAGVGAWTSTSINTSGWHMLMLNGNQDLTKTSASTFDGDRTVLFANPTSSTPNIGSCTDGGAIACGVVWAATGNTHSFDGKTWYSALDGDVIVRPGVVNTQTQLEAVVAHELGHTIGIRHSNQSGRNPNTTNSIMNSTVPMASGATLRQWDKDAMSEIYGNGIPCVAPTSVTVCCAAKVTSGATKQLSANVTGGNGTFTYQWYRGAAGDTQNPVGANDDKFTTPAITTPMSFWVKVTNECGTVSSAAVIVEPNVCSVPTINTHPVSQNIMTGGTATLTVAATGSTPLNYQWYRGPAGDFSIPVGSNAATFVTPALTTTTSYWVNVTNACGSKASVAATITVGPNCIQPSIVTLTPSRTTEVGTSAQLTVVAGGTGPFTYQWYRGTAPSVAEPIAGAIGPMYDTGPLSPAGTRSYWVRVTGACGTIDSTTIVISVVCAPVPIPEISSPPATHVTLGYDVVWTGELAKASRFELQEARDANFTLGLRTFNVNGTQTARVSPHSDVTTTDTRFYYRVRAFSNCTNEPTGWSTPSSTIITRPLPETSPEFSITVPEDASQPFKQGYLVPGFGETATNSDAFSITTDAAWLTVFPASGALSAGGTTVEFTINPALLDLGTTTATVRVTRTQGAAKGVTSNGSTSSSFPFGVSKVTPVTPAPRSMNPPPGTLIIPAVAHADGIGTRFQSDVRITNTSTNPITYEISFTPSASNGTNVGKRTTITLGAGDTKAFDDIVKAWYGAGVLGELGIGTIEIRPLAGANPLATFAASRTYAVETRGTYGQFIPAIRTESFIGPVTENALARISLQQVANSATYRTNLGFVEGTGAPTTLLVKLFGANGTLLQQATRSLPPYGHEQVSFAQIFGDVPLNDGRVEVSVSGGTGKATAYASVLDNRTKDPLLVFPVQAQQLVSRRYVVPGVAELDNGIASNFHTDMRLFNAGAAPVVATLNYFPQRGDATPRPAAIQRTIAAGQVLSIDGVLPTLWNLRATGGSVTVDTPTNSSVVVTARTFSRDAAAGTYGQFIPGVTAADGVGLGDRALELLQLEQSEQYRTNLGLVEVTGNGATVEIVAYKPDSKTAAVTHATLAPNEFVQFGRIFQSMGLPTVYAGRISVRTVEGTGRVAAYGSVVDNRTVDPTYVPAQ
jgi:hypothetical protein